jgi:hypothetical protein
LKKRDTLSFHCRFSVLCHEEGECGAVLASTNNKDILGKIMLADQNIAQPDRSAESAAFNLFRRKEEPELFCAVPEDRAVPPFIAGEAWEFGGKIAADAHSQPGFDGSVASRAARFNGFYLFQGWTNCKPPEHPR